MIEKKTIWEAAARPALLLGLVPVAYFGISYLTGKIPAQPGLGAVAVNLIGTILMLCKIGLCIYLLLNAMKSFAALDSECTRGDLFRYGMAVSVLSSLIFSAFYLADLMFIQPDMLNEVVDTLRENPLMDSNSLDMIESMMPKMPSIMFFSQLIYGILWGLVLSAIFSQSIVSDNPFDTTSDSE